MKATRPNNTHFGASQAKGGKLLTDFIGLSELYTAAKCGNGGMLRVVLSNGPGPPSIIQTAHALLFDLDFISIGT